MHKKILILGAGIYQSPLIKKAKELGYDTVVASIEGNYPGFKLADKAYYKDVKDTQEILNIARRENVDGVCTSGTDAAILALGFVCENLGLPGISIQSAETATNKLLMKRAFEQNGVRSAPFRKVQTIEDAYAALGELNKPVMFKAVDKSGSRGVVKLTSEMEIEDAFRYVFSASNEDYFIAEEWIDGIEFGAQSAVINRQVQFIMPHGDIVFKGKTSVPIGHYVPFAISHNLYNDVEEQIILSIQALQLENCAVNVDFIIRGNKVYVLEVGARAGATCLAELVSIYYAIDYYKYILDIALGENPDITFLPKTPCGSLLFIADRDGKFGTIEIFKDATLDIIEKSFDYLRGEPINKFTIGPDRIGHILIKGKDEASIRESLRQLQSGYRITYSR